MQDTASAAITFLYMFMLTPSVLMSFHFLELVWNSFLVIQFFLIKKKTHLPESKCVRAVFLMRPYEAARVLFLIDESRCHPFPRT